MGLPSTGSHQRVRDGFRVPPEVGPVIEFVDVVGSPRCRLWGVVLSSRQSAHDRSASSMIMPEPFPRRLGRAPWDGLPSPGFQEVSGRVRGKPSGHGRWLPQRVVTLSRNPESRYSRRWRRVFGSWELCISGSSVPQVSRAADLQIFSTTGPQSQICRDLETCRPSEPQASRAADLQTFGTTGTQSRRSADLRNHRSPELETCRPSEPRVSHFPPISGDRLPARRAGICDGYIGGSARSTHGSTGAQRKEVHTALKSSWRLGRLLCAAFHARRGPIATLDLSEQNHAA